jgi:hypothetical protein
MNALEAHGIMTARAHTLQRRRKKKGEKGGEMRDWTLTGAANDILPNRNMSSPFCGWKAESYSRCAL